MRKACSSNGICLRTQRFRLEVVDLPLSMTAREVDDRGLLAAEPPRILSPAGSWHSFGTEPATRLKVAANLETDQHYLKA
jgi:hypothetical protein